jgi:hypothetical protein
LHRDFMMNRLGEKRYNLLMIRANTPCRPDYALIRLWLTAALKKLKPPVLGEKA